MLPAPLQGLKQDNTEAVEHASLLCDLAEIYLAMNSH